MEWSGEGRGREKGFGCGEEGHYVTKCPKASPIIVFHVGNWTFVITV